MGICLAYACIAYGQMLNTFPHNQNALSIPPYIIHFWYYILHPKIGRFCDFLLRWWRCGFADIDEYNSPDTFVVVAIVVEQIFRYGKRFRLVLFLFFNPAFRIFSLSLFLFEFLPSVSHKIHNSTTETCCVCVCVCGLLHSVKCHPTFRCKFLKPQIHFGILFNRMLHFNC